MATVLNMLKDADRVRLDKVLGVLNSYRLKFPIAEVARRTGKHKGNVQKMLSGKIPISDNFYTTFLDKFPPLPDEAVEKNADVGEQISLLIERLINQEAKTNIILATLSSLSGEVKGKEGSLIFGELQQAIKLEADRLYDEYAKR